MGKALDLKNRVFGHLTALSVSHIDDRRTRHWHCQCSCGEIAIVAQNNLTSGNSKSCGCRHGIQISVPIQHHELTQLICYDPDTGIFTWRVKGRNFKAGDQAGHSNHANPYVRLAFKHEQYYAQVIAWFYMTGEWPDDEIDHKNGKHDDNRWSNLRLADRFQNSRNVALKPHNVVGFKGVGRSRARFFARIVANRKRHYLGVFDTAVEAAKAYDAAAIQLHGEFARLNFGVSSE